MKKFLSILLVLVMLLGILCSCNDTDKNTNMPSDDANTPNSEDKPSDEVNKPSDEDKPNEEGNPNDEHPLYTFISEQERQSWKDKIITVLFANDFYERIEYGCFGAALMDMNFDTIPELIVAYSGGTMGNVCLVAYDLESGEELRVLGDTPHYRDWNNVYFCIQRNNDGNYILVNEGSLRDGLEWYTITSKLTEDFKFDSIFEEVKTSDDSSRYYCGGNEVDKAEFEKQKEQFQNDYKAVTETQIKIIYWNSIEAKTKNEAISEMADQLVKSDQQFIDFNNEINTPNNEDKPSVTASGFENYDSILAAYRKIIEMCPIYEDITEEDYSFSNDAERYTYEKMFYATLCLYPRNNQGIDGNCYERFGYTIKDLNGDGTDELILRLDDHEVISIFTMVNDSPVLLDYYWNRRNCWIDPDGYLHISGSNGAANSSWEIYRICALTGELVLLEEGGTDGFDENTQKTLFYKLSDGEKVHITQEEYTAWEQDLPYDKIEITENLAEYFPFTSAFDEDHPAPAPYFPPYAKG